MPFKIRTKLIVAFMALISAILILTGLVGYYNISASDRAVHKVEAIAEEIIVTGDLHWSLEHVLMPANDYLITGDRKYIDYFNVSSKRVEEAFKKTDELLGHLDALDAPRVEEERRSLNDIKTAWLNIKELSLKIFRIPDPIGNKDGAMMMEEMDYRWGVPATELIHKWQKGDVEEYKEAVEQVEKARMTSWVIMGSAGAFLLILGAGFAVLYSGFFVRPIESIHKSADAIARGEFKTRLDIKTGDELQRLAGAMNEMAERLDSFYGTLENQVIERTRELRESEEKYRTMIENSNDMIWILAPDRRFTFINRQAEEVTGHSREEWLGKTFDPLVLEEELSMVFDIHNKIMNGEKVHYEVRGKKRDGGIIVLSINAAPIFKGNKVTGTISFGRDITERKEVEEKLRKSNERFDLAVKGTNDGIWDWDIETNTNYFSPRFLELLDYGPDELAHELATFEFLLHPEDRAWVFDRVRQHLEDNVPYNVEYRLRTKNGEYRWFHARGEAIKDQSGKPFRMAGSITDITERREAEEKIKEQLDYLERFQKVAVKREFRIKELRDENESLKAEIEVLKKRNL